MKSFSCNYKNYENFVVQEFGAILYFLCSLDCYLFIMLGPHDPETEVVIMNTLMANLHNGMIIKPDIYACEQLSISAMIRLW